MSINSSEFRAPLPPLTERDREKAARIATTVINSLRHGCIYFGVCNNRLLVEALESAIEEELSPHGVGLERVVLAERDDSNDPPGYRVHIPIPTDYFDAVPAPGRRLYSVRGLPELIRAQVGDDDSKIAPACLLLNYRREIFRDRALCVLFWLNPETTTYLIHKAPDFWSFRSGAVELTEATDQRMERPGGRVWQGTEPLTRWSGDLKEKLSQLEVYRKKSPPDENAVADLQLDIGRLHLQQHRMQAGFEALYEALEIFERLKLRSKVRDAKLWLARAFHETGHLGRAEEMLRDVVAIDEDLQDQRNLGTDYNDLSRIYLARGELDEAERWLRKAIEIAERLGNDTHVAMGYNHLSQICHARGQLEEAEPWLRKAIEIDERLGDEPSLAIDYNNLSLIYKARGQLEEAEKWLRKAIGLMEPKGSSKTLQELKLNLESLLEAQKAQNPPARSPDAR